MQMTVVVFVRTRYNIRICTHIPNIENVGFDVEQDSDCTIWNIDELPYAEHGTPPLFYSE